MHAGTELVPPATLIIIPGQDRPAVAAAAGAGNKRAPLLLVVYRLLKSNAYCYFPNVVSFEFRLN